MKPQRILLPICTCLFVAVHCFSQTRPTQGTQTTSAPAVSPGSATAPTVQAGTNPSSTTVDPQALNLITASIGAMGGAQGTAVQDFTATGNVTYYWAGKEENGTATVRGKGLNELRFDSVLANGTRSWAVNAGSGSLRDTNGKITPIPFHDAITLGSLIFPFARLQALSTDSSASLSYGGTSSVENQSFEHVGVHKNVFATDPDGSGNRLMDADLYFDPTTHLLVGIHDQTHPTRSMTVNVPHAIYFSDYRAVSGVMVPFNVSEYVGGQKVWTLQLSDVNFNSGLTDTDFQLQ